LQGPISQAVSNGRFVENMPNYWFKVTGTYYFSGMYTAVLPMIPGIWAIVRTIRQVTRRGRADTRIYSAAPLAPTDS
jgi:hypothetical protein